MKVVDIANEIYIDAGSPPDTSIPAISFWIRGKLGVINSLLYESFSLDSSSLEITSGGGDLPLEAIAVFKQIYRLYDYECQIRSNMNAMASNSVLSINDQGTEITRINRNSISQTLAQIRRDEISILENLVTSYRNRSSVPSQVAGDDTILGPPYQHPFIFFRR